VAEIEGEDWLHLTRSLRARVGERLRLVDPGFRAFEGAITAIGRRSLSVVAEAALPPEPEAPPLALGLCAAANEAFDASLDAAVQLGVTEFVPLLSAHSRALDGSRHERWLRLARESCCQSNRCRPPFIAAPMPLEDFLKAPRAGKKFVAQQGGASPAHAAPSEAISLVVGPEGGFSGEELELAAAEGWQALGLAPQILRVPVAVAGGLALLRSLRNP
jgi:16S rRNA (uracil1498-N3)-methyltransferase